MKSKTLFATLIALAVFAVAGCGPSVKQAEQTVSPEQKELIKRQTLDQLKRAENSAFSDGVTFAKAALLTKRSQCNTEISEGRRLQSPLHREFRDETRTPFITGCVDGARENVRIQRLEVAARAATKAKAAAKASENTRIVAVAKNKRSGPKGDPRLK